MVLLPLYLHMPTQQCTFLLCCHSGQRKPAHWPLPVLAPHPCPAVALPLTDHRLQPLLLNLPLPKLGCTEFGLPAGTLVGGLAPERLVVAPHGVAFAPKEVRPGVLPRLLQEILNTRIMVGGPLLCEKPLCRVLDGQPVTQNHNDLLLQ